MNIFLTGGASGLGREIFLALAQSGHTIYFTYHRAAFEAATLERDYPGSRGFHCDFHSTESVDRLLVDLAEVEFSALINNALPSIEMLQFQKTDVQHLADSFALNVVPVLRLTQGCLAKFRKQRSGKVITILTSYLINRPPIGFSEYIANKAYLHAMSKSWAVENSKFGISVNCISPSTMRTGLTSETDDRLLESLAMANPFGKLVEPAEVAKLVEFLLTAPQQLNSSNLILNGGLDVI